jgi:hypothetical protein
MSPIFCAARQVVWETFARLLEKPGLTPTITESILPMNAYEYLAARLPLVSPPVVAL